MKKIAIIGGGFTGLASALKLAESGFSVTVFEKEDKPGGLASGFKKNHWEWTLERHYHHWFANDHSAINLASKIGYSVISKRPKTSVFIDQEIYQLDSPFHVMTFSKLGLLERSRMASVLAFLKFFPFGTMFDSLKAPSFLEKTMGHKAYHLLWEPQMQNKFGKYKNEISLSWFWARIFKRTPDLLYPTNGYLDFAYALKKEIEKKRGKFYLKTAVSSVEKKAKKIIVTFSKDNQVEKESYDLLLMTLPTFLLPKIVIGFPETFLNNLKGLRGLGAMNLVLRLKKRFLSDETYWLSICKNHAPVTAVVEHTNFMDKKHYGNEHLVYLGNYLEITDKRYLMKDDELLNFFDSFLRNFNKDYQKNLLGFEVFRDPFAQPIIDTGYRKRIPSFKTPIEGIYLCNMEQVYPYDRGTNYAIELGSKAADYFIKTLEH